MYTIFMAHRVTEWRRSTKALLVEFHGRHCTDCGMSYPPHVMQFDHRDPSTKSLAIGSAGTPSFQTSLEESTKCDMVCANCHAIRTHRQRCAGCMYCE